MTVQALQFRLVFCLGVMLTACAPTTKKADVMDLYQLPAGRLYQGQPAVIDNDSYYSQPMLYKGCTQINDAPSCGGG